MKIKKIKLKNFRNYENLEVLFSDNNNIIIGDNAQGKTNLLESIYVLAITKSFYSLLEKDLINFNYNFAYINGELVYKDNNIINLEVFLNNNKKKLRINHKDITKNSEYISTMSVVFFSNESIRLFKDNPSSRRRYFNIQISQLNNNYLKILIEYNKLLKIRNEFLKIYDSKKETDNDYLNILNKNYIKISIKVYKYRFKYVEKINNYINSIFYKLTGKNNIKLNYITNIIDDENLFLKEINNLKEKELKYKNTLIGPNRDDFQLTLEDKNLSIFGSQGQLRCGVLSLCIAQVNLFKELSNDYPILLLDDIFSELDLKTRNNLLSLLNDNIQTIITTTDLNNINKKIIDKAKIFKIINGKLFPGK